MTIRNTTVELLGDMAPLWAALAAASAEFSPIERTKSVRVSPRQGPAYTYQYAPLEDVIAATRPALAKHGLVLIQPFASAANTEERELSVLSILAHSSGAMIRSVVSFVPDIITPAHDNYPEKVRQMRDPELGSKVTYLRRYAYQALLGITSEDSEDDEGNTLEGAPQQQKRAAATPPEPKKPAPPKRAEASPPPAPKADPTKVEPPKVEKPKEPVKPKEPEVDPRQTAIPGFDTEPDQAAPEPDPFAGGYVEPTPLPDDNQDREQAHQAAVVAKLKGKIPSSDVGKFIVALVTSPVGKAPDFKPGGILTRGALRRIEAFVDAYADYESMKAALSSLK